MRIGAIVSEWNPFHNGHQYLLENARQIAPDGIVCIMSGSFTQRGQIAVMNKWERTKMALSNGADLVLELPCIYALSPAAGFAAGAVASLEGMGVITDLIFGTEDDDLETLTSIADVLENEPPAFTSTILEELKLGKSFPTAQDTALASVLSESHVASRPNNILAIEYLRALGKIGSPISPHSVRRIGTGHHDIKSEGNFASAQAIRTRMLQNEPYENFLPPIAVDIIQKARQNGTPFLANNIAETVLLSCIKTKTVQEIGRISEVTEGLENRIYRTAMQTKTLDELILSIKTKRYTRTKIERILWKTALGITKENDNSLPTYIRVLGMNERGKSILAAAKYAATLPIIGKPSLLQNDDIFAIEARATSLCSLLDATLKPEFQTSPIVMKQ